MELWGLVVVPGLLWVREWDLGRRVGELRGARGSCCAAVVSRLLAGLGAFGFLG